ncbi:type II toxin-antitoxin system VapC family toxin [Lactococcus lactis]|uniref:type II toxin-antitoxin system VapC family toxin n=1 Tax=Lactococcus lactis TaxID=1358 RepID=UPI0028BDA20A|nr:PIN domain-containing protein [Lactococcus lactis]WNN67375.1 PIN domain-containing protein [Lactococcus lactis]WPK09878.1 PIN domain-containing protein [Lactococcus lactis]
MVIKINLETIQPGDPEEKFLIDTNILLSLVYPSLFQNNKADYDIFWEYAIRNKLKLYVTPLTISEFINVVCRESYKTYLKDNKKDSKTFKFKKNFQKTSDFTKMYEVCLITVEEDILPFVNIIDTDKEKMETLSTFHHLMKDYNDLIYYDIAKKLNFSIVTHDRDFLNLPEDIKVYTYL